MTTEKSKPSGLYIVYHVMGMPFDGETIGQQSLGGSETAAYYQAKELAARGHKVMVFTGCAAPKVTDGVSYLPLGAITEQTPLGRDFEHYARNTPHDVLIIQRHPAAFHKSFASKVNIWQLHDLALIRVASQANFGMWNIDAVTCVSEWHKKQVCEVWGLAPESIDVVPNGVDPALYGEEYTVVWLPLSEPGRATFDSHSKTLTKPHDAFVMLYQSRPERGLEPLVRPGGIMDRLRSTKAHLFVCGYENTVPEMEAAYRQWFAWADALPNVTRLSALTKSQLAALQKSCDLLVYPSNGFEEVSCITAMEAMHAGLPMLASEAGALAETCEGSGTTLIPLKDGRADEDVFVDFISVHAPVKTPLLEKNRQLKAAQSKSWTFAVDALERVITKRLADRACSTHAKLRHSIEHSDIDVARVLTIGHSDSIADSARAEIAELYRFAESPKSYAEHYAKHQTKYYDDFQDKVIGEDVTQTTRYRGVLQLMASVAMRDPKRALRILDYGCAHGHYLMPLAKTFDHCKFVGVDVSVRAIGAAVAWAQRDAVRNVELFIGAQELLGSDTLCPRKATLVDQVVGMDCVLSTEYGERELFDVILAGEVLEHVPDWHGLLEQFRGCLRPGGTLIVTTPLGRWEWTGTVAFREAREHLHHFERQDIDEICAANDYELLCAPAGADQTGSPLGSWIWGVRVTQPFNRYDMDRKLSQLACRETVSACLIVKDGERTIRKCLESIIDWVDEIIIAIDPATQDRTAQLLEQMQADYRWKPIQIIEGVSALEHGFDAARNRSVEHACGDWILWIDADEEVQQPWNLWKYLRPSQHRAFGFPQVHYACDPPQVLTTDYPCRLFRNRAGIKFFGLVHEHPETAPGEAVPNATIRHDVQFLHCGYIDETVRRQRYERNFPLLLRDLKTYPTRKLNKFLWLRDLAQSLVFFAERHGGITEAHLEQAREGIKLFEGMLAEHEGNSRMIIDAVQYYTQCVLVLRIGFEAEVSFKVSKPPFSDLAAAGSVKGWFHSAECYEKLVIKLFKEGTGRYDSKYL